MPTGGTPVSGDVTPGLTQKAINREAAGGKAVPPDAGAVAVDYAKATRTTPATAVLRVDFKAGKKTAGTRGEDPEVAEAVQHLRKSRVGYRFAKRAFDIVFSTAVVITLALPVALVCVAICLESSGAPIYAQERVGMKGRTIRVLKLRSMVADAGDVQKYLSDDQMHQWQVERKVDDDPRVTRVGAFIRKTSLDELPQFLNVLKGDLAVIGPRPITKAELEQHFTAAESAVLLSVRPGITGLWQATERNGATFESGRRQQIELRYVRECGVAMDAKCFIGTFGAMFGKKATGR